MTKVRDASGEPSAGAHDHRLGACGGPVPPETAGYGRAYATEIVRGPEEMYLANYLRILHQSEQNLADAFRKVGEGYAAEADVTTPATPWRSSASYTRRGSVPSWTATARRGTRRPRGSTASSSTRSGAAASGSSATCT